MILVDVRATCFIWPLWSVPKMAILSGVHSGWPLWSDTKIAILSETHYNINNYC